MEYSNHPTSKTLLTLSWVRYTILNNYKEVINGVVIDEIQSDLPLMIKNLIDHNRYEDEAKNLENKIEGWGGRIHDVFIYKICSKYIAL